MWVGGGWLDKRNILINSNLVEFLVEVGIELSNDFVGKWLKLFFVHLENHASFKVFSVFKRTFLYPTL